MRLFLRNPHALCLERDALLRLDRGRGWRIRCERGCLLISEERDARDHAVMAGGAFSPAGDGCVLIEARADSHIRFERPCAGRGRPVRLQLRENGP